MTGIRPGARSRAQQAVAAFGCALVVNACDIDGIARVESVAPQIVAQGVAANAHNVLSAVVTVHVRATDSIAVEYSTGAGEVQLTPGVIVDADEVIVPVLGLDAESDYILQVVAYGADTTARSTPLLFRTGSLPHDLPSFTAGGTDPTPGYVALGADGYGVVIDNSGRVVWYRRFDEGALLNFQAHSSGRYLARPATPDPEDLDLWLEIDALGNVVRHMGCAGDRPARLHDLLLERDGSFWLLCDDTRTIDLSASGGLPAARVTGTAVQHVSSTGALLFDWSPFDHFDVRAAAAGNEAAEHVNWTHGNALHFDVAGNLIVSFRNLNEVTAIDTRTGAVHWRMGGAYDQFGFGGGDLPFVGQHAVRAVAPGRLLLLDNLGNAEGSRAELYEYDGTARTARLVRSFGPESPIVGALGGSVQPLPDGHALVSFGNGGVVQEYDADGNVVWQIDGEAGYVFRAHRVASLYDIDG